MSGQIRLSESTSVVTINFRGLCKAVGGVGVGGSGGGGKGYSCFDNASSKLERDRNHVHTQGCPVRAC